MAVHITCLEKLILDDMDPHPPTLAPASFKKVGYTWKLSRTFHFFNSCSEKKT